MNPNSRPNHILSEEEELAFEALGGLERVLVTTDQILTKHGVKRALFDANELHKLRCFNISTHRFMAFAYNDEISLGANIKRLIQMIGDTGSQVGVSTFPERMLRHLVGAILEMLLGEGKANQHGFLVTGQSTDGKEDFLVDKVAIHVVTRPSEALVRKCAVNLKSDLKPVIITLDDSVAGAVFLLKNAGIYHLVDVLDIAQFLIANLYERSLFGSTECEAAFSALLIRYNEIVAVCEADSVLRICME
jgi:hypothetical protein